MTEIMTGKDDEALLRELRASGDRGVLEELVRRHVDFVYSAARRQVNGDVHLAEDVTQGVFVLLERKRPTVAEGKLAGWLFNTTRFVARNAVKMEMRRRKHERAAAGMRAEAAREEARWEDVGPVLDGAVAKLGRGDRDVVLMHYFQNMTLADVARKLGISEGAARKRSSRAVGRLREMLAKQGVACSAVGLVEGMRTYAVSRAPEAVAAKAGAATGGGVGVATSAASAMTALKLKVAAAIVGAAVAVGGGVAIVERHAAGGRAAGATVPELPPAVDLSNFRTFHVTFAVRYPGGRTARTMEVIADSQKGVVTLVGLRHDGAATYVDLTDGTGTYRFKERGDVAVKSGQGAHMPEARRIAAEFGTWRTATPVHEPAGDVTVNGERWQAYGVTRWGVLDGRAGTVWVDEKGVLRRARAEATRTDGSREFEVEVDGPLKAELPAELPKGARVVSEAQLLEELYPVKGALAVTEAASHVMAVHSARRDADGRYHLVLSVRPNAAAQKLAGSSPPANYMVRVDGQQVGSAVVTSRQDIAGVSVRDVVIVPGGKMPAGVCAFDATVLPWGELTAALQAQGMQVGGMAHVTVKVDATAAGSLEDALRETYDRVAKLDGVVNGGVSLETRTTTPITIPPGQVARDVFVATVAKRVRGK